MTLYVWGANVHRYSLPDTPVGRKVDALRDKIEGRIHGGYTYGEAPVSRSAMVKQINEQMARLGFTERFDLSEEGNSGGRIVYRDGDQWRPTGAYVTWETYSNAHPRSCYTRRELGEHVRHRVRTYYDSTEEAAAAWSVDPVDLTQAMTVDQKDDRWDALLIGIFEQMGAKNETLTLERPGFFRVVPL